MLTLNGRAYPLNTTSNPTPRWIVLRVVSSLLRLLLGPDQP